MTIKPQRIHLSRAKGFNLQDTSASLNGLPVINVARPHKWGNPFVVGKEPPESLMNIFDFHDLNIYRWITVLSVKDAHEAVRLYRKYAIPKKHQIFARQKPCLLVPCRQTLPCRCVVGNCQRGGEVMCDCIEIEIGSYENQRHVPAPPHMPKSNGYCLDECLADEVISLWEKGIVTTGCCCGHNKIEGYIGVIDGDIGSMLRLGYSIKTNELYAERIDSFHPQSIGRFQK